MARRRKNRARAKLRDGGPDASGNFDVSPYAARGHVVEVAPKELRSNPNSQTFPKRIATQRMYDRYFVAGHLDHRQWKAADRLFGLWFTAGLEAKVTGGYDPEVVSGSPSIDGRLARYLDAALELVRLKRAIPYRSIGVVEAVVLEDQSATGWARARGYGRSDSEAHGMDRLRAGLSALAAHLGY